MRRRFDQGYEAFSLTFPEIAAKLEYRPFYVCPLCLFACSEKALHDGHCNARSLERMALRPP